MTHRDVLGRARPIVGVLHLPPLPGSPLCHTGMSAILERLSADLRALIDGGVDALLLENYGDVPFPPGRVASETVAAMTAAACFVKGQAPHLPLGINVLRSDVPSAIGIAHASGASFVRANVHAGSVLTDQGLIHGQAHESLRLRNALGAEVEIWADVRVKHAVPLAPRPVGEEASDLVHRGRADALLVTGPATGAAADFAVLDDVRQAVEVPVLVASGVTPETLPDTLERCDGVIVGSALRENGVAGAPVERERVRALTDRRG